jgi:hypothetical protein
MAHPPRFRVPATRPSVEQTARELGVSRADFARVTRLVDAVLRPVGGAPGEHNARQPASGAQFSVAARGSDATGHLNMP